MGSSKEAQAARNAADRRLREAHSEEHAALMHEEHARRGLKWTRRATPEERARRDTEAKQAAAKARILRDAEKAGIDVFFGGGQGDATEGARLDAEAPVSVDEVEPHDVPIYPPPPAPEPTAAERA
jgi:pseudouridine-5'-phosphate glycosidase